MTYFMDLFAGIGGFALGAYWAGLRFDGHYYSEIDDYAIRVYQQRFPDAIPLGDISKIDGELLLLSMEGSVSYDSIKELEEMGRKSILSQAQVSEAVRLYQSGKSLAFLGEQFGVTRQAMWDLLRRRINLRPQLRFGEENHFYRGGISSDPHVHDVTEKAIIRGVLKPENCEVCGEMYRFSDGRLAVQAHHDDYNKPLQVRWLCQKCHHQWHKNNSAIRRKGEPAQVIVAGGFP